MTQYIWWNIELIPCNHGQVEKPQHVSFMLIYDNFTLRVAPCPTLPYADDINFISYSRPYLNDIERIAPACLAEWSLQINAAKTEWTSASRHVDRAHESWRTTRKLGSLLGDAEYVARRMQLANVSFHKMWTNWFRGAQISLHLRLRLYSAFVLVGLPANAKHRRTRKSSTYEMFWAFLVLWSMLIQELHDATPETLSNFF